ncbi:ABC-type transporter, ATPase component [Corynebacterium glutamicum]|nr:iron ABC transporter ATP-binding protein [Corynebacterium glutamicum]SJM62024.1 ABC-type transporter, ATPase component [Corynebacterium glutamicum]
MELCHFHTEPEKSVKMGDVTNSLNNSAAASFPSDSSELNDEFNEDLLIDFQGVFFKRDGRNLVGPVDWQVELDERWVIIGPNGAGKTTLIRMASAEEFPSGGMARLMGERIGKTDMRDLRSMIGVSSSALGNRIPSEEKVSDLVISAGYAILGRWREDYDEMDFGQATEILEQVGAMHLADRTWGTLSEGERKRVLVARALMTNPELLILDEPTAGMDLGGREDLVGYLGELAMDPDAPAIVMITHHVEEIPAGFTHAMLLDEGEIVAQGLINTVMTNENLSKAFHQPIQVDRIGERYFARRVRTARSHRAQ